jgi:hypothetical protein
MLGARGDAYAALRAADAVVGGTSQMYRGADGVLCISGALTTKATQGHSIVIDQVRAWAAHMPRADAAETGAVVTFHSCDSGKAATNPPSANIAAVVALLSTRGELTAEIAESGVPADVARCAARLITRDRSLVAAMLRADSTGLTAATAQQLREAGAAAGVGCRAEPTAGLDV